MGRERQRPRGEDIVIGDGFPPDLDLLKRDQTPAGQTIGDGFADACLTAGFRPGHRLSLFPQEIEARARLGARYTELLQERGAASTADGYGSVLTPFVPPTHGSVYAQYTIQVPARDQVGQALASEGIPTSVHYPVPLNDQPVFQPSLDRAATPVSARIAKRVISLPMHPYLSDAEQLRIADAVARSTGLTPDQNRRAW